ncbi:unnamed protein product [Periconia digitata]|uniref:NACHT domain-containing protein n=1 Tax=Periconia digitata TaxID=1303443 RepID=A0A9W4XU73_9PLEO|nr:unnamed protein product [Periconia digitata]
MTSNSRAQQEAVNRVKAAFAKLPQDDVIFRQCVADQESVSDVLGVLSKNSGIFKKKRSTRLLDNFRRYTIWMTNISSAVDTAVQVSSGIACPLWAPIKFVLKVCHDHVAAAEQIFSLVQILSDNLPRLELYERLHDNPQFQMCLVDMFADVLEFSVVAYRFLNRRTHARLGRLIGSSFENDLGDVITRIKHRTKTIDATAGALSQEREAQFIKDTQLRQRQDFRINAMRWLQPSSVNESMQSHLTARTDGTCEWILGHPSFEKWLQCASTPLAPKILIIDGPSGCGKSTLAAFIHDTLQKQNNVASGKRTVVLYFSFSASDMERQKLDSCARTLLSQLLEQTSDEELTPLFNDLMGQGAPTTAELFKALRRAIETTAISVKTIIDGIDECSEPRELTSKYLFGELSTLKNLSLILLGQQHTMKKLLANAHSQRFFTIDITSEINVEDIRRMINRAISQYTILSSSPFRDQILDTLTSRADGMFLWTKLMLDYLRASLSDDEILRRLSDLPHGLEQSYASVLNRLGTRLDKHQQRLVGYLFSFAACCGRPLKFEEIRYVYALTVRPASTTSKLDSFLLKVQPEDIVELSGGLLSFSNGAIHLMHNSVREFLIRPPEEWAGVQSTSTCSFRVDPVSSHRLLSTVCIQYFQEIDLTQLQWEHLTSLDPVDSQRPFLGYACAYLAYHLNRSDMAPEAIAEKFLAFFESDQFFFAFEYMFAHGMNDARSQVELWVVLDMAMNHTDTFKFVSPLESRFDVERKRRISNFGESDRRTARWSLFSEAFSAYTHRNHDNKSPQPAAMSEDVAGAEANEDDLDTSRRALRPSRTSRRLNGSPDSPGVGRRHTRVEPPTGIAEITTRVGELSQLTNALPLGHQFELVVRLLQHAALPSKIVDPLNALWNLIKQKAASMPLLHLVAATIFYHAFDRNEEAFEIGNICLGRMDDRESMLKTVVRCFLGAAAYMLREQEIAIEHLEYALPRMDALLGPTKFTIFPARLFLAGSYNLDGRYSDAVLLLKGLIGDRLAFGMVDIKLQIRAYLRLGMSLNYNEENQEAVEVLHKCLALSEKSRAKLIASVREDVLLAHHYLAAAHYELYQNREALAEIVTWKELEIKYNISLPPHVLNLKKIRAKILSQDAKTSQDARNLFKSALGDYLESKCQTHGQVACFKARYEWYRYVLEPDCLDLEDAADPEDAADLEDAIDACNDFWETYKAVHKPTGSDSARSICLPTNEGYLSEYEDLALLHQKAEQHAEAIELFTCYLSTLPSPEHYEWYAFDARLGLAFSEEKLGNYAAADAAAQEALEFYVDQSDLEISEKIEIVKDVLDIRLKICYQKREQRIPHSE